MRNLAIVLLLSSLGGCANFEYYNEQGAKPPREVEISCLRRGMFLFFWDQETIDNCYSSNGYAKVME